MRCKGPRTSRSILARWSAAAGLVLWLTTTGGLRAQEPSAAEQPPAKTETGAPAATDADPSTAAGDAIAADAGDTSASERVWYDSVTVTASRTTQDRTDVPANVSVLADGAAPVRGPRSRLGPAPGSGVRHRARAEQRGGQRDRGRSRCAVSAAARRPAERSFSSTASR